MNRPPRPRMMTNMYRSPRPYNPQWRPNHGAPPPFPSRGCTRFGAPNMRNEDNEEHWCETCDRGFPTVELLYKHNQQHKKCNIDGCQFVAHPKVITKHIQMQHSSGLYKKIANLNNPEDIQKWLEERKNKYPTKSNIEKKAAECKEKIERGEKMALKHVHRNDRHETTDQRYGMKRKHNNFDKRNQIQRTNRKNSNNNSTLTTTTNNVHSVKKKPKVIPSAPTTSEKNRLVPFSGILNIEMDDNSEHTAETSDCNNELIEEDCYEESLKVPKETVNTHEPVVCGALTSLLCAYGTSDEETEEKENEVHNILSVSTQPIQVEPPRTDNCEIQSQVSMKPEKVENEVNESDDDGPEEVKIVKTNIEHETAKEPVTKNKEKVINKIIPPRNLERQNYRLQRKIPSTLLQKLLHKEIRKERNIVLQCIRYIKRNNYFDKPKQ